MNFIAANAMLFSVNFVLWEIFILEFAHHVALVKARKSFQSFSGEKGTRKIVPHVRANPQAGVRPAIKNFSIWRYLKIAITVIQD